MRIDEMENRTEKISESLARLRDRWLIIFIQPFRITVYSNRTSKELVDCQMKIDEMENRTELEKVQLDLRVTSPW